MRLKGAAAYFLKQERFSQRGPTQVSNFRSGRCGVLVFVLLFLSLVTSSRGSWFDRSRVAALGRACAPRFALGENSLLGLVSPVVGICDVDVDGDPWLEKSSNGWF